jgi:carbamoylphosphate synthase large subunit
MKFYCIVKHEAEDKQLSTSYLKAAVEAAGHEFVLLGANDFDYVKDIDKIETPSMMYRVGIGMRTAMLEVLLQRKGVVGFHKDTQTLMAHRFPWGDAVRLQHLGMPNIPTILNVSSNEDAKLARYVEQLGGFPVIVKAAGGSHGVGVMKVDSLESLRSVIGFISNDKSAEIALRQFIHNARHIRVVVIGGTVADIIEYNPQSDDFRTNAVSVPSVVDRNDLEERYRQIAIDAVAALDLEFGGVDLLIDTQGNAYIAEVNYPCNFARNQMNTHTDIAAKMVEYLYRKARSQ